MLRSIANPRAAELWRTQVETHHQRVMTAALQGDHAAERAALILSLIAGFQVMRQMIGLPALAEAEPRVLARILAGVFRGWWRARTISPGRAESGRSGCRLKPRRSRPDWRARIAKRARPDVTEAALPCAATSAGYGPDNKEVNCVFSHMVIGSNDLARSKAF